MNEKTQNENDTINKRFLKLELLMKEQKNAISRIEWIIIIIFIIFWIAFIILDNIDKDQNSKIIKIQELTRVMNFNDFYKQYLKEKNLVNNLAWSANSYDTALIAYAISKTESNSMAMKISFQKIVQYATTYSELQKLNQPEFKQFLDSDIRKQIQDKLSKMKL